MQKLIHLIDRVEHHILVWTIVGLAVIGFFQVFGRYVFNYSFTWFEELGRYLGVLIAFLGAGIGAKKGAHFSMDLVVQFIELPYRHFLKFSTSLISSAFFFLLTYYSWKIIGRMHTYQSTSPTLGIPMYIAYLPILIFSFVMGFRFLVNAVRFLKDAKQYFDGAGKEAPS